MNFVVVSRTIEPHAACMLFISVQDAQGLPVPDVQLRLWANTPLDAETVLALHEKPNRRTDVDGKYEYLISASPIPQELDLFVQIFGADQVPQSEPIQFHFPADRGQRVSVILAPLAGSAIANSENDITLVPDSQHAPSLAIETGGAGEFVQPDLLPIAQTEPPHPTPLLPAPQPHPVGQPSATAVTPLLSQPPAPIIPLPSEGSTTPVTPLLAAPIPPRESEVSPSSTVSGQPEPVRQTAPPTLAQVSVSQPVQPPSRVSQSVPTSPAIQKFFEHYLLFGPSSQQSTLTYLILALDYIVRFSPIVGFSVTEARYAHHVVIVGDTNAVSADAEEGLRDVGCVVARLTASDSYALENLFKRLIASGSPYPS